MVVKVRETLQELRDQRNNYQREAALWFWAYKDVAEDREPVASHEWTDRDGIGHHIARLYGTERCNGGYVMLVFRYPRQSDSYTPVYLDDWQPTDLDTKIAKERLMLGRHNNGP